jgi:hypothetical protein
MSTTATVTPHASLRNVHLVKDGDVLLGYTVQNGRAIRAIRSDGAVRGFRTLDAAVDFVARTARRIEAT